jgi:hypothetical protein
MSTLLRRLEGLAKRPEAVFRWQLASRNRYRLLCGAEEQGSLTLALEPSILFLPSSHEYFRGEARIGDDAYYFKCVFLDGQFRGCLLTHEQSGQPLAFFEDRPAPFMWCRQRRIVLCESGRAWPWVRGREKGQWIVRDGVRRILETKGASPEKRGMVRLYSSELLRNPQGRAFVLFCVYLAMEPRRAVRPAA